MFISSPPPNKKPTCAGSGCPLSLCGRDAVTSRWVGELKTPLPWEQPEGRTSPAEVTCLPHGIKTPHVEIRSQKLICEEDCLPWKCPSQWLQYGCLNMASPVMSAGCYQCLTWSRATISLRLLFICYLLFAFSFLLATSRIDSRNGKSVFRIILHVKQLYKNLSPEG